MVCEAIRQNQSKVSCCCCNNVVIIINLMNVIIRNISIIIVSVIYIYSIIHCFVKWYCIRSLGKAQGYDATLTTKVLVIAFRKGN